MILAILRSVNYFIELNRVKWEWPGSSLMGAWHGICYLGPYELCSAFCWKVFNECAHRSVEVFIIFELKVSELNEVGVYTINKQKGEPWAAFSFNPLHPFVQFLPFIKANSVTTKSPSSIALWIDQWWGPPTESNSRRHTGNCSRLPRIGLKEVRTTIAKRRLRMRILFLCE